MPVLFNVSWLLQRYVYGSGPYVKVPKIPPLRKLSRKQRIPHKNVLMSTESFHLNAISASKDLTVEVENINNAVVNAMTMDKLKSIFGLRPQVIQDFSAMFEKFPHDNIVTQVLYSFVSQSNFLDLKNVGIS